MIIKIHNTYYNISNFIDIHPGGVDILKRCEGLDATPAFESYHALSDMNKIKSIMKKYEINNPNSIINDSKYTFKENEFYDVLKKKVKQYFKNKNTKCNIYWIISSSITFILYLYTYYYTFLSINQPLMYRFISSFISGVFLMSIIFQVFHDGTHSAISKNKYVNKYLSQIIAGLGFWDYRTWIKHHSISHHSFTGNYKLDPDMRHFHPYFKKSKQSKANNVKSKEMLCTVVSIFPGMYFGQMIAYFYAQYTKNIWGINIDNKSALEWFIVLSQMYIMYYSGNLLLVATYILSLNLTYSISILPDHDQLETRLNEKLEITDWGEQQVRNSGNFVENNTLYTRLFGSINYQIEHHLFPSLCSWHLPDISKIVKDTCKEFNINYVTNPSFIDSYMSAINHFYIINNE